MDWDTMSVFLGIGIMVAIITLASSIGKAIRGGTPRTWHATSASNQVGSADRQKALQVYENLAKEKMDVMKTALAMGWNQDDLSRLDARLEKLIGKEQLQQLARGEVPIASADLQTSSVSRETALLREIKAG
jgi:hypothetical protein